MSNPTKKTQRIYISAVKELATLMTVAEPSTDFSIRALASVLGIGMYKTNALVSDLQEVGALVIEPSNAPRRSRQTWELLIPADEITTRLRAYWAANARAPKTPVGYGETDVRDEAASTSDKALDLPKGAGGTRPRVSRVKNLGHFPARIGVIRDAPGRPRAGSRSRGTRGA